MDYRYRTKTLALASAAALIAFAPHAGAQNFQAPTYQNEALSQAQRNPELPKGLTFVPWKIERRGEATNDQKANQRELQIRSNRQPAGQNP